MFRMMILLLAVILSAPSLCVAASAQEESMKAIEPNIETAKTWWDDLPKKWTVLGWPEHITRFNVLFDGTLVNHWSFGNRYVVEEPFAQFAFIPASDIDQVPAVQYNIMQDYGDVVQGWNNSETPVLWSEWPWNGYLLRKEVFAHVPGGGKLSRGDEPLFAWVRLSVHYACPGIPLEENVGFGVRINNICINLSMELKHNLSSIGGNPKYPRDLKAESEGRRLYVLEPDGRVRLAVINADANFKAGAPAADDSLLHVKLSPKQGAHADLLIPMLPTDRETFERELALGYDGALREAEAFWTKTPAAATKFEVAEDYINQAIRRNLQFDRITSEKDPATGDTYVLTGGLGYGLATWGTPVSMALAGFLDPLGYHSLVEDYLKIFKDAQGEVMPPGDAFELHPGYLGVPPRVKIVNWLPDHGAILWAMAEHGLLTGDPKFIEEYTPVIVKACEWIHYARRIEGHGGVPGIMPPAGASDDESRIQNCWTDGWIYKGLITAVEFLKRTNHPRATEFEAEARDYRETFVKAFRAKAAECPTWTDDQGKIRRMVPFSLSKEQDWQWRHLFYLDTGPMFQVFAGMMDADDPLMRDALAWYREGPPTRLYRPYGDLSHVPSLRYEMSSWECCYSWNVYHSWRLGDRQKFLEGLYSQFAGGISQQTYTVCESRGGMTSNIFWIPAVTLARLAVIDDQIEDGRLHLLRICPLAWLEGKGSTFERMPTRFGPVNLRVKLDGSRLDVNFALSPHSSTRPVVVLHIPPVPGLKSVMLNGNTLEWGPNKSEVTL